MLRLLGGDWLLNLRASSHPEFDAWRWHDYWVPLDVVVEFKRGVYEMALTELARHLPADGRPRSARFPTRPRGSLAANDLMPPHMELPPGAVFDPIPQFEGSIQTPIHTDRSSTP